MRVRLLSLLFFMLLCLAASGCRRDGESSEGSSSATSESAPADTEESAFELVVIPDLLMPLDSYSWPREVSPEYVMLHFSSDVVASREDPYNVEAVRQIFLTNGVSTHYLIDREGTVYCYIPEDRVAWHAGKGSFGGDDRLTNNMNHYAIGIEILAIGSREDMAKYLTPEEYDALDPSLIGYTEAQYQALAALLSDVCSRYEIPFDRGHIIGHEDYRPSKNDPGELFDWDRLFADAETD